MRINTQRSTGTGIGTGTGTGMHQRLGQVRFSVRELGEWPDAQVRQTVGIMRERVKEDAANPEFSQWAWEVCGANPDMDKVANAYAHVKRNLRFERDEVNAAQLDAVTDPDDVVEVIIRPLDMKRYVEQGVSVGDCDDYSMYLAALLEAVGIPCSFVTVAADSGVPWNWSHIYVAAYPQVEGTRLRIALDASHGNGPGWEADQIVEVRRKTEWTISGAMGWVMEAVGFSLVALAVWWGVGKVKEAVA